MPNRKLLIAPSILSADFSRLGEEIRNVERAGADIIHVDVMDGAFVPNLTIGPLVIQAIRQTTQLPLDVHLMIDRPERYVKEFRAAGADWLTIHCEATDALEEALDAFKQSEAKVGLSLKPNTTVETILPYLDLVDLVLVMSVEPGFGGQSFIPAVVDKITTLRTQFQGLISIDGGINAETARRAVNAGVDILVAGSYIFGAQDRTVPIQALRHAQSETPV